MLWCQPCNGMQENERLSKQQPASSGLFGGDEGSVRGSADARADVETLHKKLNECLAKCEQVGRLPYFMEAIHPFARVRLSVRGEKGCRLYSHSFAHFKCILGGLREHASYLRTQILRRSGAFLVAGGHTGQPAANGRRLQFRGTKNMPVQPDHATSCARHS